LDRQWREHRRLRLEFLATLAAPARRHRRVPSMHTGHRDAQPRSTHWIPNRRPTGAARRRAATDLYAKEKAGPSSHRVTPDRAVPEGRCRPPDTSPQPRDGRTPAATLVTVAAGLRKRQRIVMARHFMLLLCRECGRLARTRDARGSDETLRTSRVMWL
jgi:hypothetical protein